jgi:transcriptional regulator GlxA family with amidase domain
MMAALIGAAALLAPPQGQIPVAFVISEGATMIDFAGPWEVFQDVHVQSRGATMEEQMPFKLYTVADSRAPIRTSGGMQVTPDYTFADAPAPAIVVVGAQGGKSKQMLDWLRRASTQSQVLMSVCTGAYKLAMAGILDGKKASTHHDFWDDFQRRFPKVSLERGVRYVQSGPTVFTAGGLTSGIDLALHVVELYFGRDVAVRTASYMEYESKNWMRSDG